MKLLSYVLGGAIAQSPPWIRPCFVVFYLGSLSGEKRWLNIIDLLAF